MLINCTCKSTAQDSLHGKQRRVANKTTKVAGTVPVYRCTCCGAERAAKDTGHGH